MKGTKVTTLNTSSNNLKNRGNYQKESAILIFAIIKIS